jgi:tight adherence protein B
MAGTSSLIAALAVVCGAIAAAVAAPCLLEQVNTVMRTAALRTQVASGPVDSRRGAGGLLQMLVAERCRNGIKSLRMVSRRLIRWPVVYSACCKAQRVLHIKGLDSQPQAVLELSIAAVIALILAVTLMSGQLLFGCLCAVIACWLAAGYTQKQLDRWESRLREQLPDALRSIGLCFASGLSLQQAMQYAASETEAPISEEFHLAACDMQAGRSVSEALALMQQRTSAADLTFVAAALEVQHSTGGSLQDILENAAESIKSSFALRRELQVQTAQARLSARVVSIMPLLLMAAMSLAMEGYLAAFTASLEGFCLLGMAVGMEVAGIVAIRRILSLGRRPMC